MRLTLATLALNERHWLPALYEQHKDWPGLCRWVFVESADRAYAEANPDRVTGGGLSVDGTSEFLAELAAKDPRVVYAPYGFSGHADPAQGKCAARNVYLEEADRHRPDFLFVLDADEFVCRPHQARINELMGASPHTRTAFMFGLRSIWRPPCESDRPLMEREAIGCLWSVPICRGWRWVEGARYTTNHNTPTGPGGGPLLMRRSVVRFDLMPTSPYTVHMGYAAPLADRAPKRRYYEARGEGTADHRWRYVECRRFFEECAPGQELPHGARAVPYTGLVPEVFQEAPGGDV